MRNFDIEYIVLYILFSMLWYFIIVIVIMISRNVWDIGICLYKNYYYYKVGNIIIFSL